MLELFKRDIVYKVAAILLSILLWFYVTNLQNPIIEKSFSVPVNYYGLQEGLIAGEKPENVNIKVKGSRSIVDSITAKDIKADVNLEQALIGDNSFLVKVTVPSGVELTEYKPTSAEMVVDAIQEKQLEVKVEFVNKVAQGYSSIEPDLTTSRVVVRGATRILNTLEAAKVTIDLNQAKDNLMLTLPVNLINKNGEQVTNKLLVVSPASIQAYVPVIENIPTKTVPIEPVLVGNPKETWKVSRTVLEPETVKITGSYETLQSVERIKTHPVDITNLEDNLVTQALLDPPEGVSLLYEPTVKILIQVEEKPIEKTIKGLSIETQNVPQGKKVILQPDKVDLLVQGHRDVLENIKMEDIRAIVNLDGLKESENEVEITVDIDSKIKILKVDPGKAKITIAMDDT